MTSLGVWTVPKPFPPGFKYPGLENESYLEVASSSKDGLAITENGRSVKVQTEGPHLVSLGGGRLNSAITIHPLPEGRIYIGNSEARPPKDVVIQGKGIERDHCFIDNNNGLVTIYPQSGDVSIDGVLITEPTCLSQGCMLCLGRSNYFRFNNPKEAHLMKQASPAPRKVPFPAGFIPVESLAKQQPHFKENPSIVNPYMDGIDLVEKVSKYEYMSHSQSPPITSQDTPKYFVKEGVRILHSAPPVMRVHKGYSSENSIKNPSPVSRIFSPLASKPGFSTPPPYPHRSPHKVAMSPKTSRLFSKTPDPVIMGRKSPATVWSGRCTPTSPLLPGCRSHHVSVENLKACELELHEQHRKAVQERLRDQEQEKQERQRLEEILHLCAEYEEQVQKERANKAKLASSKQDPASNSSSGEFSSVSTDSSVPASTNSSNNSNPISSKSESNIEGYSSDDSKCNGTPKYPTLPSVQTHQNQLTTVNNVKPNSSNYALSSGYHTVPNRIKTNGSLPRERTNVQLSPTSDSPFSQVEGVSNSNGATMFVNHKALNSASSEDELCAILGNSSITKQSPTNECGPSSPCMGTAFLTYPHSPRTRIKTVAGHRERGPEVYENKMAVSEVTPKKNLTLPLPSSEILTAVPPEKKPDFYDGTKYINDNYHSPNHIGFELVEEINKLQKEKQACLQAITTIKHKVSELDCQKNEVLNELQLEHALISGELKDKDQLQIFEGNKLSELQKQKLSIEQKYELTQEELETAKAKIHEQENLVQSLQNQIHSMKLSSAKESEISDKLEELKAQTDLLEIERKAFEDLEFQQLESQAHEEEEKEELAQEIECFKETIAQRQIQLSELTKQKQSLAAQMDKEKLKCENQLRVFTEQLRQEVSNLDMINSKLKALTSVKPGATPCSSPESSPRTSDSDIEKFKLQKKTEEAQGTLEEGKWLVSLTYYKKKYLKQGQEWWDLRSKTQKHLMKPKAIEGFLQPMQDVAKDLIALVESKMDSKNEVTNILEDLYKWALESVAVVGMDTRLGCLERNLTADSDGAKMIKSVQTQFDCMNRLEPFGGNFPFWKYFPSPTFKKYAKEADIFTEIAFKYINLSLEALKKKSDDEIELTLLQSMLLTKGLDVSGAMVTVADMLMAGIDTTSHTVGFLLYHLAKNPDKQEILANELKQLLPNKEDRITPEVFKKLHYLKACLKEAIRLDPIVRGTARTLDHDVVVNGYRIPAGTAVVCIQQVIYREEKYFKNADKFLPERWLNKEEKVKNPFAFVPFGIGSRSCVGRRLAELEILCLATEILRKYSVEYHYEDIDMITRIINIPDRPLRFTFLQR